MEDHLPGQTRHVMSAPPKVQSEKSGSAVNHRRNFEPTAATWMVAAFCAALVLTGLVLAVFGSGARGTQIALRATARLSFLLFWPAYAGSALAALLGPTFMPLKRHAREFGLAFASAHIVHLGLVGWLTYIGYAPGLRSFVFFGIAAFWTYLLLLFSVSRLQQWVGQRVWWWFRTVGLNYIILAFAKDFVAVPPRADLGYVLSYVPFVVLCAVGPVLYWAPLAKWFGRSPSRGQL
jgi:hypothetical protein